MNTINHRACESCRLRKVGKNNIICRFCDRRIQAAKGEPITAKMPSLQDIKEALEKIRKDFIMYKEMKNLTVPDKIRVCRSCGGEIAINNSSGYCADCYRICGEICKMPDCNERLSNANKSGLCKNCYNIVYRRKHEGLPESEWYLPASRRWKKKEN